MTNNANLGHTQEPWDKLLEIIIKAQRNWLAIFMMMVFIYLSIFMGDLIGKEILKMIIVFWYASLSGLAFFLGKLSRPSDKHDTILIPSGVKKIQVQNRAKLWLSRIRLKVLILTIIFSISSIVAFCYWIDREICNQPPTIEALHPEAYQLRPSHKTKVKVWVNDPEGDSMTFEWDSSFGEIKPDPLDNSVAIYTSPGTYGQQYITVIVKDDRGKRSERSVIIDVRP